MAGIFVNESVGGVPASKANSAYAAHNAPTCAALYYPATCGVKIEGETLNAWISELVCAVDSAGLSWDCDGMCNLAGALLKTGTLSGYCGATAVAAAAQKGAALKAGDYWLNPTTGVVYYVDAGGASVAMNPGPSTFVCCKTGKIYTMCGGTMVHLEGSGDAANFRLEGICAEDEAAALAAGLSSGGFWIDTNGTPKRVYVYSGSGSVIVNPQPDFFACCNSNSLYVRCGNDYFDPANCQPPAASGSAWTGKTWSAWWGGDYSQTSSHTFTAFVGPDATNRKIVVATNSWADCGEAEHQITGVTIGGNAATKLHEVTMPAYANCSSVPKYSGPAHLAFWVADFPTGDTCEITVTASGNSRIFVHTTRIDTATAAPEDSGDISGGPGTITLNASAGAIIIAASPQFAWPQASDADPKCPPNMMLAAVTPAPTNQTDTSVYTDFTNVWGTAIGVAEADGPYQVDCTWFPAGNNRAALAISWPIT